MLDNALREHTNKLAQHIERSAVNFVKCVQSVHIGIYAHNIISCVQNSSEFLPYKNPFGVFFSDVCWCFGVNRLNEWISYRLAIF